MEDVINVDTYKGFKCTSYNPYGFWKVSQPEGGATPKDLNGSYTTLEDTHRSIDGYLNKMEQAEKTNAAEKSKEKVLAKKIKDQEEAKEGLTSGSSNSISA